jgi:hypothetical protein
MIAYQVWLAEVHLNAYRFLYASILIFKLKIHVNKNGNKIFNLEVPEWEFFNPRFVSKSQRERSSLSRKDPEQRLMQGL